MEWYGGEVTNQFQPVDVIFLDIFRDVSVSHPFRNSGELSFFDISVNPHEFQNVRMGQGTPEYHFLAELLEQNHSVLVPTAEDGGINGYLSYLRYVVGRRDLQCFHRNEMPHVQPAPDICKPSIRDNFIFDFYFFCYHHRIRQSSVGPGEPPQRDEETLFFDSGFEVVSCNALMKISENAKERCGRG